ELSEDMLQETQRTADAGYASAAKAAYGFAQGIDASSADTRFRKRDPRLHAAPRPKPTRADTPFAKPKRVLKCQAKDLQLADAHAHARCPAGQRLDKRGGHRDVAGLQTRQYRGPRGACGACRQRAPCLRSPERTAVRHVTLVVGRVVGKPEQAL